MQRAPSPKTRWRVLVAAMLGATCPGCDDILGLEELRVSDASSSGESLGGSGGSTSSSAGGAATGGSGGRPCGAPLGPELMVGDILDPLAVAVGADRVFWIEKTRSISTLKSSDFCGDDPRTEALANGEPGPYLSAFGADVCWVTNSPSASHLQCGNKANRQNKLDQYTSGSGTLGDVALTANGVYWLEGPEGAEWIVRYAARGGLDSPSTVYTAGPGVFLTAIAASADVVAWLEYNRDTASVVTAPATGTDLQAKPWFTTGSAYKDVAVFGKRVLYTDGTHVRELDPTGGPMPTFDYAAGTAVRKVAFDPAGERFALATDEALGPWFAIQLQDDIGAKIADGLVEPSAFAVSADAVYWLQTMAGSGLYRQARALE